MSVSPICVVLLCDHQYNTLPLRDLAFQSAHPIKLSVEQIQNEADEWPVDDIDVIIVDLSGLLKLRLCPGDLFDTLYSQVPVILVGDACKAGHALAGIRAGAQDWLIQEELTQRPLFDVLERARHEFYQQRNLVVSQAQYQSVVEDQTHLICRFLPDEAFTLTFVNQAYATKLGKAASTLKGESLLELTPYWDRRLFQRKVAALTPEYPEISYERQMIIDGDIHWIHWSDKAVFDSNGAVMELQSVGTDVSTLRPADQPVEQIQCRFQAFFQNAPIMMQELDAKGRILNVNRCWSDAAGYRADEVKGDHFYRYMDRSDQNESHTVFDTLLQKGWIKDKECQLVRSDGQVIDVLLSATSEFDEKTSTLRFLTVVNEARYVSVVPSSAPTSASV